jgi:hypothetical protein
MLARKSAGHIGVEKLDYPDLGVPSNQPPSDSELPMPKKKVLLEIGPSHQIPDVTFPSKQKLSKALGAKIPLLAFKQIIEVSFLYSCLAAHKNQTKAAFAKKLKKLTNAVLHARSDLTSAPVPELSASAFEIRDSFEAELKAFEILNGIFKPLSIKHSFHDVPPPFNVVRLSNLINIFDALLLVCNWIHHDSTSGEYSQYVEGFAWNAWICQLSQIMMQQGLPHQVSKASVNPSAKVSPFVKLVDALQSNMPAELRRHHSVPSASKDALAQAIVRARKDFAGFLIEQDGLLSPANVGDTLDFLRND